MPTLTQQEIALRSSVYRGFYNIATSSPTVSDDRNKGYVFGSRWLRTDAGNEEEFVCINNAPSAAIWISTTAGGGAGGGIDPHIASTDPTVNDDTGDGYVVGQLWINTNTDSVFVATDVSTGAAVWLDVSAGGAGGGITPHTDTIDPVVGDDNVDGYAVGQLWINTTTDTVFVATDVSTGAAVWVDVSTAGSGGSGGAVSTPETLGTVAIAVARVGIANTPQLLYDGFADGCLDTDLAAGTTTYSILNGAYTNNSAPTEVRSSGTASASSVYSDDAAKAVDSSDTTRWSAASAGASWFKIDFGAGNTKLITSIVIKRSLYDGGWTPVVESSSDGSSWTPEYTHSALAGGPVDNTSVTLAFTPSGSYRYWRVSGTFTGSPASWNDFKIYETLNISSPIYESVSRSMPYRPVKVTIVVVANISTLTLNTDFVASYSSNGGTNYEAATLVAVGAAPYGSGANVYVATITPIDRGTQACRIKIAGGAAAHSIYGIAFIGQPEVAGVSSTANVDDLALDVAVANLQQAARTQQLLRGDVLVGVDLTGLVADPATTFISMANEFKAKAFGPTGSTNVVSGLTATRSTGTTTTAITNGNTGDYDQIAASVPVWWRFDFGVGVTKIISKVRINQYYDSNNSIKDFSIQGSPDATTWTPVYTGVMPDTHNSYVDFEFVPASTTAFRYFRIYVSSRSGSQTSSTIFEIQMFDTTYVSVTNPILTSITHTLPDEPAKAVIAIVANIDTLTLNSTFVLSISNNGGTNYDAATLVDRGSLVPYTAPYKLYTTVLALTDRNSQDMRIKVQGTGTSACSIKAIAVQYTK